MHEGQAANRPGLNQLMWTVVLFAGGSILFGALRRLTRDESTLVTIGVQVGALVLVIGAIALVVRLVRD
jgi:hypothetical protein